MPERWTLVSYTCTNDVKVETYVPADRGAQGQACEPIKLASNEQWILASSVCNNSMRVVTYVREKARIINEPEPVNPNPSIPGDRQDLVETTLPQTPSTTESVPIETPFSFSTEEDIFAQLRAFSDQIDDRETPCPSRITGNNPPPSITVPLSGTSKGLKILSPTELRAIEISPANSWTKDQKILLVVIRRWYYLPNRSTISLELQVDALVFNTIFGLDLSWRKIATYFDDQSRKCSPEFVQVWMKTPFEDPTGCYTSYREVIDSKIRELDVGLIPRTEELQFSPTVVKLQKAALRKIKKAGLNNTKVAQSHQNLTGGVMPDQSTTKTFNFNTSDNLESSNLSPASMSSGSTLAEELATNTSQGPINTSQVPNSPSPMDINTCHLAFRVWDSTSYTPFSEDAGFTAQMFANRVRPVPKPLPMELDNSILEVLLESQFSFTGNCSAFVSVATCLLQVLKYASQKTDPRCAIINLDHPSLNEPNKRHNAGEVMRHLKDQGEIGFARYKGQREICFWGNVPMEAILHTFSLAELGGDDAVQGLLRLDLFGTGKSPTRVIAQRLRGLQLQMNPTTAKTFGKIAKIFGLNKPAVTPTHIKEFVSELISGWSIQNAPLSDILAMSELANAFVVALNPQPNFLVQDHMAAFMDGVQRGMGELAFYAPRTRRQ